MISIFFTVEYCIGYLSYIFIICSSTEERLSCYHFLVIMTRTAMNTAEQAATWYEIRSFGHMLAHGHFGMHFPCAYSYVYDQGRCAYVFMGVLAHVCNAYGSQRSRSGFLNCFSNLYSQTGSLTEPGVGDTCHSPNFYNVCLQGPALGSHACSSKSFIHRVISIALPCT